ncbi:tail fiber assembly protein [Pseudomonas veronii]|uniref:Tail fiber assembly protein n=1 Tax=Pseudomonas veronii TaxID=76761 RepID=A0A4P7Y8E5_PSEVE|nr:tail fiber assembly protein [Pseudomonas veronii]QCG66603.1 tail fiber assembly protein [Pseudomonas veronii]QCG67357.1 tail fiber assembly protein [Pseudomonas veronii]
MKTFTIGGMKFYGNPEQPSSIYAYEADGSADAWIPSSYILLDEKGYDAIRAIQAAENAPTPDQLLSSAMAERDSLLAIAALRIAPLQDAVDLDEATPEDIANLKLWKQYRIALNRLEQQTAYPTTINWPIAPS